MRILTVDGRRISYLDEGSGHPTLVLIHAFPFPAAMWQAQLEALSDRWRLIAPDLPGFGKSDPFEDVAWTSTETMANAVAGLIRQLDVGPVVVGGLSMGGYVTLALLRHHRPLVQAVVLADSRAGADTPEILERRTNQQAQVRQKGTAELFDTMLGTLLSEATLEGRPEVVQRVRELMETVSPDTVVAALEAMKLRPDATDELGSIDVPTLVMVGEHDTMSPPDVAEEMCGRLPQCRLAVIPQAAHLSNLESPDAFTSELRSFLETL